MDIVNILIPVFLALGLGALSVKTRIFTLKDSYLFSKYDYYIAFPILIFYTLLQTDFEKISDVPFLLTNILNLIAIILIAFIVSFFLKTERKMMGIVILGSIYGNVAYMGIPINQLLFGEDGVSYASVIVGIVSIFALSIGIFLLEIFSGKKSGLSKILSNLIKSPIIIAVVLGILASAFQIRLFEPLENFLSLMSKSAAPVALFAIGMFLVRKHTLKHKKLIVTLCVLNLIILPIVTFFIADALHFSGTAFKVSLLEAGMPLAATNFVIAQKYKIGEEIISDSIVISTLFSIFTLGGLMVFFI